MGQVVGLIRRRKNGPEEELGRDDEIDDQTIDDETIEYSFRNSQGSFGHFYY